MKPIKQTVLHDPESGQYGNCMQAFIASVLELPLDSVPHFYRDGCDAETFHRRVNDFLGEFNLALLNLDVEAHVRAFDIKGIVHELSGESSRGVSHATVGKDGHMIHDPHPSGDGILTPWDYWGIFVVRDPAKPSGRFAKELEPS